MNRVKVNKGIQDRISTAFNHAGSNHDVQATNQFEALTSSSGDESGMGFSTSYREAKQEWISNQTGGSIAKINLVSLTALTTYALWAALRSRNLAFCQHSKSPGWLRRTCLSDWQLELAILVLPMICANTVLASHLVLLNSFLAMATAWILLHYPHPDRKRGESTSASTSDSTSDAIPSSTSKGKARASSGSGLEGTLVERRRQHWSQKYSVQRKFDSDLVDSQGRVLPDLDESKFRVSIDSAGDAANAEAAPAVPYTPPPLPLSVLPSLSRPNGSIVGLGLDESPISGTRRGSLPGSLIPRTRSPLGASQGSGGLPLRTASPSHSEGWRGEAMDASLFPVSAPLSQVANDTSTPNHEKVQDEDSRQDAELDRATLRTTTPGANPPFVQQQPFLTVYRAHMMLMTIICILAVDFRIFPREFAKCETWGTSLMDLGVGSFVFSLGLVSALPFLSTPRNRFRPLRSQLVRDARKSLPLLVLGLIRVVTVKGTEYPEHVSEYGVHWNFFITLGLLPLLGTLCRPFSRLARYSVIGLLVSCCHQVVLASTRLEGWAIHDGERHGIAEQNKEGLVSMPGYLAIFLLGLDLGHYVLPQDPYLAYRKPSLSRRKAKTGKLAMILASYSVIWWTSYVAATLSGLGTSRRLANLSYTLWVTAFNTSFLLFYVCIYMALLQPLTDLGGESEGGDVVQDPGRAGRDLSSPTSSKISAAANIRGRPTAQSDGQDHTPTILRHMNDHSFAVFLLANPLTGAINLSIETMNTPEPVALAILVAYSALCCWSATLMSRRGWKLKL
ncbi:GWT1-domain-containing protein [Violaceomyces palustris]|uniref:GWT1-domain-containing protein n=1 Tax=Violaceomyces palustris TaxID=1673888 RepID=A0ACD0P053_9BASI|nr:GWT1-domain-containing protein [Violaceomyces palustris]